MQINVTGRQLDWGAGLIPCAIGRSGIGLKGGEGDGITPLGILPVRRALYRPDRLARPKTDLPLSEIAPDDGWCDAPGDTNYNTPIKLPYPASAEKMWRDDHLYDVVIVLGFNDDPIVSGKGSAIFLHIAKPDYAPTEGCVALAMPDILTLLEKLKPGDSIRVSA